MQMTYIDPALRAGASQPTGWFCFGLARDLRVGQVKTVRYFDQDYVMFRTRSGTIRVAHGICPHMGGLLTRGAVVRDEWLQCPNHQFCFDEQGQCISTPQGVRPPNVHIRYLPVRLYADAIMVYIHPTPTNNPWAFQGWTEGEGGWSSWLYFRQEYDVYPIILAEDLVDMWHVLTAHRFHNAEQILPFETDGPIARASYTAERTEPVMGTITSEVTVKISGVGFITTQVDVPAMGLSMRYLVLPRPIGIKRCDVLFAFQMNYDLLQSTHRRYLRLLPKRITNTLAQQAMVLAYWLDNRRDQRNWERELLLTSRPGARASALFAYRKWAAQFHPGLSLRPTPHGCTEAVAVS